MRVRVIREDDIPGVVALVARVYPEKQHLWRSPAERDSYFRELLFANPWYDSDIPSWLAEEDGLVTGVYVVLPRWMAMRERTLRVAVGCQFMVDPLHRNGLAWLQLAKACLSGSQDLTLADAATDQSRRLWLGLGGAAPPLYSLHWTRPLRPARYALSRLEARDSLLRPLALAARPLGALADACAARLLPNGFLRGDSGLAEEALDAAAMLAHLPEVLHGTALWPHYDARALAWLLDQAARKTIYGALRARAVLDGKRWIGWYLYHVRGGGVGEVLQIAACHGSFDRLLQQLLADAWRQGATAVHGRLDPRYLHELSACHCWLRQEGTWTLAYSRHPQVLAAFEQGQVFLSRLEGEWWLRFLGA
jgi:hypothetical protein